MTILEVNRTALAKRVLGEDGYQRAIRKWGIWKQRPRVGHVRFGQLRRTGLPICREYGFARGLPHRPVLHREVPRHRTRPGHRPGTGDRGTHLHRTLRPRRRAVGHVHFNEVPGATYAADLTDAPHIPSHTYDCIIITQTLQFIFDMKAAVATLHASSRPAGWCSAPCRGSARSPTRMAGELVAEQGHRTVAVRHRLRRRRTTDHHQWQRAVGDVVPARAGHQRTHHRRTRRRRLRVR